MFRHESHERRIRLIQPHANLSPDPAFVPDASKDPDFGQAPPAIRVSRRLAE